MNILLKYDLYQILLIFKLKGDILNRFTLTYSYCTKMCFFEITGIF
jgi:hypothetical protein